MSTTKQTVTKQGFTSSSGWTWKQVIEEIFEDNYLETNESTIVVRTYLGRTGSGSFFGGSSKLNITCEGVSRDLSKRFPYPTNVSANGWVLAQEETFNNVKHNEDGTKTISVSSSLTTSAFTPSEAGAIGSVTLTTIPRTTECPNLDGYIESSIPISLNPATLNFKHRLYYSYNGKTDYYPSSTGYFTTSGYLNLGKEFYAKTPSKIGIGELTLYTYDRNNKQIGTSKGTLTLRCDPEKCKPLISATVEDINSKTLALTGDKNKIVKGFSNAKITYTITPRNGATITSKQVNNSNLGSSPYTINNANTNIFDIVATDSRGFSSTYKVTKTLVNYFTPSISFNAERTSPTGSEINAIFNGSFFNSNFGNSQNTITLSWKYREYSYGSNEWINGGNLVLNTNYKVNGNTLYSGTGSNASKIILNSNLFDYQKSYEIGLFYQDKLKSDLLVDVVTKGEALVNWEDEILNVNGTIKNYNKEVGFIIESGSNSNGNWIKFSDGTIIQYNSINYNLVNKNGLELGYKNYDINVNFPVSFLQKKSFTANIGGGTAFLGQNVLFNNNSATYRAYTSTSSPNNINATFSWIAIGKWK